jgi:hypothetical protein
MTHSRDRSVTFRIQTGQHDALLTLMAQLNAHRYPSNYLKQSDVFREAINLYITAKRAELEEKEK